jgi:hydrogenase maturation protein HypF
MPSACSIRVRGAVQGVGFRPFVYRLARANTLFGWVLNDEQGVEIHLEGNAQSLENFVRDLQAQPPAAATISEIDIQPASPTGIEDFTIRESEHGERTSTRVSPDLPVCEACLSEMSNPANRRYGYPYINCTNCGPRYTVILALPYDRPNTTMKTWLLDSVCSGEYHDPTDRRFHAQPIACPECGPNYSLRMGEETVHGDLESVRRAALLLNEGKILAVKGLGGYHLACDAWNASAVAALRARKYRKEKPFAIMASDLQVARSLVDLSPQAEALLTSQARPIVLATAKAQIPGVAPHNQELGVMLPYTPLHYLLFAAGAPGALVMTSANRSNEPIAYEDDDALQQLSSIADAFLIGQRPIARRVDDSVARVGTFGPAILRRARGYAPGAAATIPAKQPILAVGADLKNTITLVVDGQAFVSQHIGDLEHFQSFRAFKETVHDLVSMYEVKVDELLVVHDCHPQYVSASLAAALSSAHFSVQHHRAHIASVVAERGEWEKRILGVSLDGTGFGDDGTIWGGEIFLGSVKEGFQRIAHLRQAVLPGGDAAAQYPVQAAAGFLNQIDELPLLSEAPFGFPARYGLAAELVQKRVRTFATTSMGRLFDTTAALLGFTREITFEGQAAMWLEQLARTAHPVEPYPFPFAGEELDFRPLLKAVIDDRMMGRSSNEIARAFQRGVAKGLSDAMHTLAQNNNVNTVALSGGVFQNELLLEDLKALVAGSSLHLWTNSNVPSNDGGISLGQAALAAFGQFNGIRG